MLGLIRGLFDHNEKQLKELKGSLFEVKKHFDDVAKLKDEDFPAKTQQMRDQVQSNTRFLNDLLPYAYALCREASIRTLGFGHFDEQIMAGVALHQGKIVEQKTGEGKTLTATLPLYLNALVGKGVHLVTVNDYLARRDAGWMGKLFAFLGLTTAAIISDQQYIYDPKHVDENAVDWRLVHLRPCTRQEAYQSDITYGINSEFGFDYLRDNMANSKSDLVQRDLYYAIIDEADSILIDEARTPHIISAPVEEDTSRYYQYANLVKQLGQSDYKIDEKLKTVHLTDSGIAKVEKILGVDNIYEKDFQTIYHLEAALKAETLYKRDRDYIVRNNEVVIVDEFTGRLLFGRRFSEGLHQALEAKENVLIKKESRTLATISLQNYFRMYTKLGGMTGTAITEAQEFDKIYGMDTVAIPTHRVMLRKDHPDMIYKTEAAKVNAVVENIVVEHAKGRPILVGTTSIQKNEMISNLLKKRGIPHQLLNAKNHEQEAQIIAKAGQKGAVTVATNMAGRGVDIILGGEPPNEFTQKDPHKYQRQKQDWELKHKEVVELGGLYVIGTERHESRRIDNQLRGRAGRQGDPGDTRFFVSLEDDLMRIFGGEQIAKVMSFLNFPEDQPISHRMVSKAIEQSQVKVEGFNFDIRRHLVNYDDVLNKQREIIYSLRRKLLLLPEDNPVKFRETMFNIIDKQITGLVRDCQILTPDSTEEEIDNICRELIILFPSIGQEIKELLKKLAFEELEELLKDKVRAVFIDWESKIGEERWHAAIRSMALHIIDNRWTEYLTAIENLREGINLRGYAQVDPLVAYKNEAYTMFEQLIDEIYEEILGELLKNQNEAILNRQVQVLLTDKANYNSASAVSLFNKTDTPQSKPKTSVVSQKVGRNDPCPCGSGKKFKKCCGRSV